MSSGINISSSDTNRKNDLILIMTPEKQDKTLELIKHWSVDSTPARNEVIMKRTYPVKSVKCNKICSFMFSLSLCYFGTKILAISCFHCL